MSKSFIVILLFAVLKVNSYAQSQFLHTLSTNNNEDHIISSSTLSADTNSVFLVGNNVTNNTAEILKLNQYGMLDWAFSYSPNWPFTSFTRVDQIGARVYAGGNFQDNSVFVLKLDSSGQSSWSREIYFPGTPNTTFLDMIADSSSLYLLLSVDDTSFAFPQAALVKMDTTGSVIWSKLFQADSYVGDLTLSVSKDRIGMLLRDNSGFMQFSVLDLSGSILRSTHFPGDYDFVLSSQDSGFVLFGDINSETLITKTDRLGNSMWSVQLTDTNGYLVPSWPCYISSDNQIYVGESRYSGDPCMTKLTSAGSIVWSKSYAPFLNFGYTMSAFPNKEGDIWLLGQHNVGFFSQYFMMDDDTSNSTSCVAYPVTFKDSSISVLDSSMSITAVNFPSLTANISYVLTPIYFDQSYECSNGLHEENVQVGFKVYPNPTSGTVIFSSNFSCNAEAHFYNLIGEEAVKPIFIPSGSQSISINLDLPNGMYFCRTFSGASILGEEKIMIIK